jgi:hypothetical protein
MSNVLTLYKCALAFTSLKRARDMKVQLQSVEGRSTDHEVPNERMKSIRSFLVMARNFEINSFVLSRCFIGGRDDSESFLSVRTCFSCISFP